MFNIKGPKASSLIKVGTSFKNYAMWEKVVQILLNYSLVKKVCQETSNFNT